MGRALKFFVVAMSVVVAVSLITLLAALGWMKWDGFFDGYSAPECRRLQRVINDDEIRAALVQWVDNDLERTLQDWVDNGPFFPSRYPSPGQAFFEKHDFDVTLLGFAPEEYFSWPKVGLVIWNPKVPHYPQSQPSPEEGIEYLLSVTRSVSFTEISRVALLVRLQGSPDFGVDPSHIKAESGRLAVYCEPRD